ncbi:MAG: Wzz/FepE/Etk N-terminal domain-containing protein [Gammaproteobacteria bacterium]|nr:Wzz/FepE/Etk N-terminal domain-containing protein [Gammaproteobacteria bacterium]MDH3768312.1 Wzz/FepE/Etk N-terminal domain-containing protein [Gammaproteobacteria bacterium]
MVDKQRDVLHEAPVLGEEVLDVRGFVTAAIEQKALFITVFLLVLLISIALAFLLPKKYRAEVLLVPATDSSASSLAAGSGLGGIAGLIGLDTGTSSIATVALEKLDSRGFTERFIETHRLMDELFPNSSDDDDSGAPRLWDAYERFDRLRRVGSEKSGALVRVTVDWYDGAVAARWANQLVADLNTEIRESVIQESEEKIQYLEKELGETSNVNLRSSIFRLMEAQIQEIMLASVVVEYAFKIVDPAVPPDEEDFIFPRRPVFVLMGVILGLLLGILAAVMRASKKS